MRYAHGYVDKESRRRRSSARPEDHRTVQAATACSRRYFMAPWRQREGDTCGRPARKPNPQANGTVKIGRTINQHGEEEAKADGAAFGLTLPSQDWEPLEGIEAVQRRRR